MLLKMHTAPSYSSGKNVFWNVSGLLFIGSFWRSPGFLVQISLQGNSLSVHIGCLLVLLQDRRQIFRAREQNKENTAHSFAWFSVPFCLQARCPTGEWPGMGSFCGLWVGSSSPGDPIFPELIPTENELFHLTWC